MPPYIRSMLWQSKNVLFFLHAWFGLLYLFGLLLHGFGDLLHNDLLDFLLDLLGLTTLILNGFCHLLLDRFEYLGNDFVRHFLVNLLRYLDSLRLVRLLGDFGAGLGQRNHPLFQDLLRFDVGEALYEKGDDSGPAGLMACTNSSSGIAVEVLVEQDVV